MSLEFSTKAGTLTTLSGVLKSGRIAPLRCITVADWQANADSCMQDVISTLGPGPWIVRSSCSREDGHNASNAGAFLSIKDVQAAALKAAIEQVINSYGRSIPQDEVLIQPMLQNVICSGVAFSHDPNTCAPYRVVNWMDGDDTSAVTSGAGGRVWQQAAQIPTSAVLPAPTFIPPLILLIEELLLLFGGVPLDCEFAVTHDNGEEALWLLQVRSLILSATPESAETQAKCLNAISHKLARGMQPQPFLKGRRTVYGVMPDWNPAEILGIRPKPLALSLYRELITDATWAYQRHNYGYRNLRSFPLMPHFFGLPYIDVRLSFNSFVPDDLDEGLADRLVDFYTDCLLAEPTFHDKVEFEIVFSCYTLDLPQQMQRLRDAGFSVHDCQTLADSLRRLTNRIVCPDSGLWRVDARKIDTLNQRRECLLNSAADPLERIYWLLEDTKRYGTLPFAGLARAGFVAVQMLRSLVEMGVFTQVDYDAFLASTSTVSRRLAYDRATLDKSTFLARYGHLRPGTYDILSPRYDEAPEAYFDWGEQPPVPEPVKPFMLSLPQIRDMDKLIKAHGLQVDPLGLLDFMQAGIELRELSKFHFTRNLSDAMALMVRVGEQNGFSREELAYSSITAFQELHVAATDPQEVLARSIEDGRQRHAQTLKISLPPLITDPNEAWAFQWPDTAPNFITQKQVSAPVMSCDDCNRLAGAIVCIPNADPGFDWLFAYPVAGLITAWGGVNSHMAIRAGELGLPAVIGAGELLYRRWSAAQRLHLDCAGRRVEVLD